MIGVAAAAVVVFLVLIMQFASAPSYSTLMTGLDPAQTGKITSTLRPKGIGYELQNNGTALAVESDKTGAGARRARHRRPARRQASSRASRCSTSSSSARATSSSRSPTSARSRASSARRSRASRASSSAQVQLVLPNPQDQLFSDSAQPSTAAVLLSGSTALDPTSVRGIAQLVASSVPGLHARQGDDHRCARSAAVADRRRRRRRHARCSKQAARPQYDSLMAAQVERDAHPDARRRTRPRSRSTPTSTPTRPPRTRSRTGKGDPAAAQTARPSRSRAAAAAGGAAGTAGNIPGVAADRRRQRPRTTRTRPTTRRSASTRPSPTR